MISKDELKNLLFASVISADNDRYTEEVKQEVISRYWENKENPDWEYIFEPLGNDAERLVKLMKEGSE